MLIGSNFRLTGNPYTPMYLSVGLHVTIPNKRTPFLYFSETGVGPETRDQRKQNHDS